jgi:mono/diheme cytochrome c family protein
MVLMCKVRVLTKLLLPALMLLAVTVATPGAAVATGKPPKPQPGVDQALYVTGRDIYLASYCGSCHTLAAAGARGVFGPTHDHLARTAARRIADPKYKGDATIPADYIRESILSPNAFIAGGATLRQAMPPYTQLAAADLDALVYFLAQQQ